MEEVFLHRDDEGKKVAEFTINLQSGEQISIYPSEWSEDQLEVSSDLGYDPATEWMDPAGGVHSNDEDDPAAMYEGEWEGFVAEDNFDEALEEAYADESGECERCFGLGRRPSGGADCEVCGGSGRTPEAPLEENTCERCNGRGYDDEDEMGLCPSCDGSGKKTYPKQYSARPGTRIRPKTRLNPTGRSA